jgi:hypothetical protein
MNEIVLLLPVFALVCMCSCVCVCVCVCVCLFFSVPRFCGIVFLVVVVVAGAWL